MVDEGQAETFGVELGAGDSLEAAVDRGILEVVIHQVEHRPADRLDHRPVHGPRRFPGVCLAALAQHLLAHPGGRFLEANGETAGARTMLARELGGEALRILVDEEIHPALTIDRDRTLAVAIDGLKAHLPEQPVQRFRLGEANSTN